MSDSLPFPAGYDPALPQSAATLLIATGDEALLSRIEQSLACVNLTCLSVGSGKAALRYKRDELTAPTFEAPNHD